MSYDKLISIKNKVIYELKNLNDITPHIKYLINNNLFEKFIEEYGYILFIYYWFKGDFSSLRKLKIHKNKSYFNIFNEALKGGNANFINLFEIYLRKNQINNFNNEDFNLFYIVFLIFFIKKISPYYNKNLKLKILEKTEKLKLNNFSFLIKNTLNEYIEEEAPLNPNFENLNLSQIFLEFLSYAEINYVEDWDVKLMDKITDKLLKNNYDWIVFEFSYLLKQSTNLDLSLKWDKIYNELKEKFNNISSISKTLKVKSKKELIIKLIKNEIENTKNINKKSQKQIIWLLDKDYYGLNISLYYRELLKSGKYSKPRELSNYKILEDDDYSLFAQNEDKLLAIKYSSRKIYNIEKEGEFLINMKNIYNCYDLNNNIVFKKTKFPIEIYDTPNSYGIAVEKIKLKKDILIKKNDYLYNYIKLNKNTLKLLKELQKKDLIFDYSEKEFLINWIKVNNNLDIDISFYYPDNITPKTTNYNPKVVYLIDYDKKYFYIEIKISPADNWKLYHPLKKGITLIKKVSDENYLMIKREIAKEKKLIQKINSKFKLLPDTFQFKTKSLKKIDKILKYTQKNDSFQVRWSQNRFKRKVKKIKPKDINWTIKDSKNWFEASAEIQINENEKIKLGELMERLAKENFTILENGDIITITKEFRNILNKVEKNTIRDKNKFYIPPVFANLVDDAIEFGKILEKSESWEKAIKKYSNLNKKEVKLPPQIAIKLRTYQRKGVLWLSKMTSAGFGVCLADDMGLGKTIQTIMTISINPGKTLIVTPASVLYNWKIEINKFTPKLKPIIHEGKNIDEKLKNIDEKSLLIISYDKLQKDISSIKKINWEYVVLDEAHMIKNSETKRSKAVFELNSQKKIALTGTPIENNITEIWSLFHFLNPILLGTKQMFRDFFALPIEHGDEITKELLKDMIKPFLLRRLKEEVLNELPEKIEIIKRVELKKEERLVYEALRLNAIKSIQENKDKEGIKKIKFLAYLTKMRQAVCDISLVGEKNNHNDSSKTNTAVELIKEIIKSNHKVLVFSQFTSYLKLIKDRLQKDNIEYLNIEGSTSKKKRQELVNLFQKEKNIKVFLISLKAGGLGLNLTAANYVIHLDPWWNPAVENQATDRTYRIGQKQNVTVYKIIAQNTIEEKIIDMNSEKKTLSESILKNLNNPELSIDLEHLMNLI